MMILKTRNNRRIAKKTTEYPHCKIYYAEDFQDMLHAENLQNDMLTSNTHTQIYTFLLISIHLCKCTERSGTTPNN